MNKQQNKIPTRKNMLNMKSLANMQHKCDIIMMMTG